jgi:hypothetical protein
VKTVRVEPEAKQELAAAAAWYEQRRGGLGRELLAEVDAVLAAIGRSPSRFPLYPRVARTWCSSCRRSALSLRDRVHRAPDRRSGPGGRARETTPGLLGWSAEGNMSRAAGSHRWRSCRKVPVEWKAVGEVGHPGLGQVGNAAFTAALARWGKARLRAILSLVKGPRSGSAG